MFGYSLISDHHEQKKIICLRPSDLLLQCTDIFNSYIFLPECKYCQWPV